MIARNIKTSRGISLIFLNICSLAVISCATKIDPELLNSPVYHEGYADGCQTGMSQSNGFQSKIVENSARSDTNETYRIGWSQGFYACGGHSIDPKTYNNDNWHHDIGD